MTSADRDGNSLRTATPGLDLDALRAHLDEAAPDLLPGPLHARLITGGKSNLTYAVGNGHTELVLRRPPLGHVLATAHDMQREHRVMSALGDTPVPVPAMHLLVTDETVLGAPFYLMELVPGISYVTADQLRPLGPERTWELGTRMMDVLGALHAVDPDRIGLGDFGRADGFCARQVRRWGEQLQRSHSRELASATELQEGLAATVPEGQHAAIVHGDFRLDNLLVDDRNQITAVLDWEMATLGDPLTDLGLLTVYNRLATLVPGGGAGLVPDVSLAPGYPSLEEQLTRYSTASGRDVSRLNWYCALAYFKLAVILEGIHYRHTRGQTVGDGFAHVGDYVEPLLDTGLQTLREG